MKTYIKKVINFFILLIKVKKETIIKEISYVDSLHKYYKKSQFHDESEFFITLVLDEIVKIRTLVIKSTFLGSGYFGKAYKTPDGKTLKITRDLNEIKLAKLLLCNNFQYTIKIYNITEVYYNNVLVGAIILKEYVDDYNKYDNDIFWNIMWEVCNDILVYGIESINRTFFVDTEYNSEEVLYKIKELIEYPTNYINIIKERKELSKEFNTIMKALNLESLDIHPQNFGFINGKFKLFDISGFS